MEQALQPALAPRPPARAADRSEYIRWAKLETKAPYNLCLSGVRAYPLSELPVRIEDLEITGPDSYGYQPLVGALAAKCGVPPECVVTAVGTSMANHLAMAALLAPGDEVLIEHPAYEPLISAARFLGAEVRRFPRPFEDGFQIDPRAVERALTPRTRLIVVTNLHNPSGALTSAETLRAIGELAREAGARILVDEVYLEAAFSKAPLTAFRSGGPFVTTGSLTKAYGLSGLRCGWILAEPALAERIWRLNDLFGVVPAHAAERLCVIALQHLDRIAARAQRLLEVNRSQVDQFLDGRRDLQLARPPFGTIVFPRLAGAAEGQAERLFHLLREKFETTVVPGAFFEAPGHFRLGMGMDTAVLTEGLRRLGAALDELGGRRS